MTGRSRCSCTLADAATCGSGTSSSETCRRNSGPVDTTDRVLFPEDVWSDMAEQDKERLAIDRRGFLLTAGAGLTAAGAMLAPGERVAAQTWSEKDKLARIAS